MNRKVTSVPCFLKLDFTETSQKELGIDVLKVGEGKQANLFNSGVNPLSLAFGKLDMTSVGDNHFTIADNTFDFDHQPGSSMARNLGTYLGDNVVTLGGGGLSFLFGGPFNVKFSGSVYVPK